MHQVISHQLLAGIFCTVAIETVNYHLEKKPDQCVTLLAKKNAYAQLCLQMTLTVYIYNYVQSSLMCLLTICACK